MIQNSDAKWTYQRTPATTSGTGQCRHASATLGRGPAVGPPARAASRRCHRKTAATPATTATTRCSTAISACRTPCFKFSLCFPLAEFKYITNSAYICKNSPIYINISKFRLSLNVFHLFMFEFAYIRSFPWARRWENGPPHIEVYIHPVISSAGFRPEEPQRLEML
jgi:hypothetical protein